MENIGGGIVHDSDPYDEWLETMNKLGANMHCITSAEEKYSSIEEDSLQDLKEGHVADPSVPIHLGNGS